MQTTNRQIVGETRIAARFTSGRTTTGLLSIVRWQLLALLACVCLATPGSIVRAQQFSAEGDEPAPPIDVKPESPELISAIEELRQHMGKMNELAVRFNTSPNGEGQEFQEAWYAEHTEGRQIFEKMVSAAVAEFESDPQNKVDIARWLYRILARNVDKDQFEGMYPVAKALLADKPDSIELNLMFLLTAFAMNEYEAARPSLDFLIENGQPTADLLEMRDSIDANIKAWEDEQRIREQDAQGEPLPRILIRTTKGPIEVELFENHAPDTVGNFISLIEAGAYERQPFAIFNLHYLIQGGGDATDVPPYAIESEADRPDARKFFRGTLGMALAAEVPDSAYSQFFIALVPHEVFNRSYTAFGRVTKGMNIVSNLVQRKPETEKTKGIPQPEPDEILEILILNKREHAYEPKKVENFEAIMSEVQLRSQAAAQPPQ